MNLPSGRELSSCMHACMRLFNPLNPIGRYSGLAYRCIYPKGCYSGLAYRCIYPEGRYSGLAIYRHNPTGLCSGQMAKTSYGEILCVESIQWLLHCIESIHLYSAYCSAHQSEALPVQKTQREESSLESTKRGTWLTN